MKCCILIGLFVFLFSCVSVPSQDIVVRFSTIDGVRFLEIPKGSLDEEWHGLSWLTKEEHKEKTYHYLKEELKRKSF